MRHFELSFKYYLKIWFHILYLCKICSEINDPELILSSSYKFRRSKQPTTNGQLAPNFSYVTTRPFHHHTNQKPFSKFYRPIQFNNPSPPIKNFAVQQTNSGLENNPDNSLLNLDSLSAPKPFSSGLNLIQNNQLKVILCINFYWNNHSYFIKGKNLTTIGLILYLIVL